MITRKELMDVLEEVDTKRITIKDYIQEKIIDVFEKRGLIEHEPTAKEKYLVKKELIENILKYEPGVSPDNIYKFIGYADAAIAEAEEGARK